VLCPGWSVLVGFTSVRVALTPVLVLAKREVPTDMSSRPLLIAGIVGGILAGVALFTLALAVVAIDGAALSGQMMAMLVLGDAGLRARRDLAQRGDGPALEAWPSQARRGGRGRVGNAGS
jgi:hypothetical protein